MQDSILIPAGLIGFGTWLVFTVLNMDKDKEYVKIEPNDELVEKFKDATDEKDITLYG